MSIYQYNIVPDRLEILCGIVLMSNIFPCEKCKSENCTGKNNCKGYGSYQLGISYDGKL